MTEKSKSEKQKPNKIKQKRVIFKRKQNLVKTPETFSEQKLRDEILLEAKALNLPVGTAEIIATKVAEKTAKWVMRRAAVTQDDINRRVAMEAKQYNADLAYVYQNRGKII